MTSEVGSARPRCRGLLRVSSAALVLVCLGVGGCARGPSPISPAPPPVTPPPSPKRSPLRPFIFYVPNRIKDVLDVVSFGVGIPSVPYLLPASAHANVHVTRAFQAGAGGTHGLFLGKGYRSRFAWVLIHHELSVGPLTVCELKHVAEVSAEVGKVGILVPSDPPFDTGQMDYFAVGAHAGLLPVALELDVHPVELLDAIAGFFLLDITGDDY